MKPVAAVLAVIVACSGDPADETPGLGPMAVMVDEATGASEASAGRGTVNINSQCVTFTNDHGTTLLLVWRSPEVAWDEDERSIIFTPSMRTAERISVADGDTIVVGGEPFSTDDGLRSVEWRAEPQANCPSAWFIVNSLTQP